MYFKNDKLASPIEGYFKAEKDDWNISIGFGNIGFACAIAREDLVQWLGQRSGWRDLNSLMESEEVEGEFIEISFEEFG